MAERAAPEGLRPAEQGTTDARLFVPEQPKDKNELQEEAPEDAEAPGEGGPEGGEAV